MRKTKDTRIYTCCEKIPTLYFLFYAFKQGIPGLEVCEAFIPCAARLKELVFSLILLVRIENLFLRSQYPVSLAAKGILPFCPFCPAGATGNGQHATRNTQHATGNRQQTSVTMVTFWLTYLLSIYLYPLYSMITLYFTSLLLLLFFQFFKKKAVVLSFNLCESLFIKQ